MPRYKRLLHPQPTRAKHFKNNVRWLNDLIKLYTLHNDHHATLAAQYDKHAKTLRGYKAYGNQCIKSAHCKTADNYAKTHHTLADKYLNRVNELQKLRDAQQDALTEFKASPPKKRGRPIKIKADQLLDGNINNETSIAPVSSPAGPAIQSDSRYAGYSPKRMLRQNKIPEQLKQHQAIIDKINAQKIARLAEISLKNNTVFLPVRGKNNKIKSFNLGTMTNKPPTNGYEPSLRFGWPWTNR